LSGGIDSVVLFDALWRLRDELPITKLEAIHVNHGLSANADAWQRHCEQLCRARGAQLEAVALRVARRSGESLEAAAREARYRALPATALRRRFHVVAVAHHLDDQSETVLLQLLRGGSPRGVAAMPEWRTIDRGLGLWRPFVDVPRSALVEHATAFALTWIEDESNADARIKRNHLRHQVLPALERGFEGYRSGLARAARRAADSIELADDLADIDLAACASGDGLSIPALQRLSALRRRNLLHRWLSLRQLSVPESDRLAEFARQAVTSRQDRQPSLRLDALHRLSSANGKLVVMRTALGASFAAHWRNEREIALPHGILRFAPTVGSGIDAAKIPSSGLLIRPRLGGERLRLHAERPSRTLKNLLREAGIAAPLRPDWPLLAAGDASVIAVPGIGVGVDWQCPPGSPGWAVAWEHST
jgi:tRNA(Ile)-lysidine synthase